jgi:hypothetical protein
MSREIPDARVVMGETRKFVPAGSTDQEALLQYVYTQKKVITPAASRKIIFCKARPSTFRNQPQCIYDIPRHVPCPDPGRTAIYHWKLVSLRPHTLTVHSHWTGRGSASIPVLEIC